MSDHPIQGLMKTAMENLKQMIDVNTIVGDPVETPDGSVILTVSKVGFGFAAGGSEFNSASKEEGDGQGQIKINGVNVNTNALGTGDSPSFTNLTVTGDLTVAGTRTELQVTELNVEDKNITLAD